MKISLGELEEARKDPRKYFTSLVKKTEERPFIPESYFSKLRFAIYKYHSTHDALEGYEYLKDKLAKFKLEYRKHEIEDQYNWYVNEHLHSGRITSNYRQIVSINITGEWILSGEVCRLDVNPTGGYMAWLFLSQKPEAWFNELRMPLIQDLTAKQIFHVNSSNITVGVYCFKEKFIDQRLFNQKNIDDAYDKLNEIIEQMENK